MSTRETYDLVREQWRYYHDAYRGGRYWRVPSATTIGSTSLRWTVLDPEDPSRELTVTGRERSYLVAHQGESDEKFVKRHSLSAYVNVASPIVKAYAEGVTARVQRETAPIAEYLDDVDRRGRSWGEIAEGAATWASVYGVVATVVDTPSESVEGLSEAQRRERGIQPYVVTVHPPSWAWIECAGGRVTEFAYVSTPYQSSLSTNQSIDLEVRVWRADKVNEDGERVAGGWEVRQGTLATSQLAQLGEHAQGLPLIASGPLAPALAGEIPVTFAYYERDDSSECPSGQSLIADASDIGRLIYNTLSWVGEIDRLAAFPFLSVPLKDTGGMLDQSTKLKIGPGQAVGHSGSAGAPAWVEPSGASQTGMLARCVQYMQFAMRSAGLELAADSSAQVQSGEALRIRSRDFESRALRFARNMQRWETATLRLIALLAGKPADDIAVTYAKRITHADPAEDLERALTLLAAPVEIGPEARALAVVQAIDATLSLSDEKIAEIADEVRSIFGGDLSAANARQIVERLRNEREASGLQQLDAQSTPAPVVEAQTPESATASTVADTALNGAQVASLLEIITAVAAGTLPIQTASEIIRAAFPSFDDAGIERMVAPLRGRQPISTEQPSTDRSPAAPPPPAQPASRAI